MGHEPTVAAYFSPQLQELARRYGVELEHEDVTGQRRIAQRDTVLEVLAALGAPLGAKGDVAGALRHRRQEQWRRWVEPVHVTWDGEPAAILLRAPAFEAQAVLACTLRLETGEERRWSFRWEDLAEVRSAEVEGVCYVERRLVLPEATPLGYHRLTLETHTQNQETLLLAAPTRAWSPRGRGWERCWGVFTPLYALHSQRSWGAGDLGDLQALRDWVHERGGGLVGVLPLLAAYLDETYEISPYSPVSRLFWNEFYLNIPAIPEVAASPAAQALLNSTEFRETIEKLRAAELVDYRRQMALKRRVLEELARSFFATPSERFAAFTAYRKKHPRLEDYAAFRAVNERLRKPWSEWPAPLSEGVVREGDYDEQAKNYHMYVQWLVDEQLQAAASGGKAQGTGLYLDLPLGVNAHGYDVWRQRRAFAVGMAGGCPPDLGFPKGQNWGFTPLHPEGIREQGYAYVRAYLENQLRFAKVLRIDHMPSFHRMYWIPPGRDAREGVYVRYPADELYALFCLESHRHQTMLVGEDLGTVPPEVPLAMARHNFHRMYVVQYEMKPDAGRALPEPPASSIASVNTHDMPPFASFWSGQDIGERRSLGLYDAEQAGEDERVRAQLRHALVQFLQIPHSKSEPLAREVLQACLAFLRDGPARMVLVTLEDLWLETQPQNIPSTYDESPNWRRKLRYSLEELRQLSAVGELLEDLARGFPPKHE